MALDIYTSPCCSSWTCNVRYTAVFSLGVFALSILNCIVSSAHKSINFSTSSVFQLVFPLTSVAILKLVSSMRCISEACAQSSGKVRGARMSVYTTTKNRKVPLFSLASPIFQKKGQRPDVVPKPKNTSARRGRFTPFTQDNSFLPCWK